MYIDEINIMLKCKRAPRKKGIINSWVERMLRNFKYLLLK